MLVHGLGRAGGAVAAGFGVRAPLILLLLSPPRIDFVSFFASSRALAQALDFVLLGSNAIIIYPQGEALLAPYLITALHTALQQPLPGPTTVRDAAPSSPACGAASALRHRMRRSDSRRPTNFLKLRRGLTNPPLSAPRRAEAANELQRQLPTAGTAGRRRSVLAHRRAGCMGGPFDV